MAEILNRQTEIIVFDWDGFLAQSLKVWLDAFRAAYMSHNLSQPIQLGHMQMFSVLS